MVSPVYRMGIRSLSAPAAPSTGEKKEEHKQDPKKEEHKKEEHKEEHKEQHAHHDPESISIVPHSFEEWRAYYRMVPFFFLAAALFGYTINGGTVPPAPKLPPLKSELAKRDQH